MTDKTLIPFHVWKDNQLTKDKSEHGIPYFRERAWYWSEYGRYVKKFNKQEAAA